MPKYSIITCVSDPKIYDSCLLSSIRDCRKRHDIEIIPILNKENRYSASLALNIGIDAAKSDRMIFVHQDVKLLGDWFDDLDEVIDILDDNWGIIGSAGIASKYRREDIGLWGGSVNVATVAVGSVWDSDKALAFPPYWDGTKDTVPIHCVDECLFVQNKKCGLRFDTAFNGFHFYGVDICLQARAAGYGVFGSHLPIIHYGQYSASFSGDRKYWNFLRYLHHKWHRRFPELLGTHMHWAEDELTSYISIALEDQAGYEVKLKAMGIEKIRLHHDADMGIIS